MMIQSVWVLGRRVGFLSFLVYPLTPRGDYDTGMSFRMRGFDTSLGRLVFWTAPDIDDIAAFYVGPGPVNDIVIQFVISAGGSGASWQRVAYTATGAEGADFFVPIGTTLAADSYEAVLSPQLVGGTFLPVCDFPNEVAGDRTTTQFRVRFAEQPPAATKFIFLLFQ